MSSSPLKYAIVAYFNLAKRGAQLRAARGQRVAEFGPLMRVVYPATNVEENTAFPGPRIYIAMPIVPFSAWRTTWTTINGRRMHAKVSPPCSLSPADSLLPDDRRAEAPLVLVHGLGVSGRYMAPLAECLADTRVVFVPDLPGFGKSEKPAKTLTIPELADSLAAWARAAGIERAAFLGNSLGCQVIVELALREPAMVERAILVSPTVDRVGRTFVRQLGRACCDLWIEPWRLWPILLRDYLTTGTWRLLRTLRWALADPVEQKLPQMRAPTLVVHGERDRIVPGRWAEEVAGLLPRGRLVVIPQGTHAPNFSTPQPLAQAVDGFLNNVD